MGKVGNIFENYDRALGISGATVYSLGTDRKPLRSTEEKQLALYQLHRWIRKSALCEIKSVRVSHINLSREELILLLRNAALDYVSVLFLNNTFQPYQGHFLKEVANFPALKQLYWGKCLNNTGIVWKLIQGIVSKDFPDLSQKFFANSHIGLCQIDGLVSGLQHYTAFLSHPSGDILFWDFTVPQYWDASTSMPQVPIIWGHFPDKNVLIESLTRGYQALGANVRIQLR